MSLNHVGILLGRKMLTHVVWNYESLIRERDLLSTLHSTISIQQHDYWAMDVIVYACVKDFAYTFAFS